MKKPGRHPIHLAGRAVAAASVVGVMAGGVLVGGLTGGKASADNIHWFSAKRLMADCDGTAQIYGNGTGDEGWLDGCHYEEAHKWNFWRWRDGIVNGKVLPLDNCRQPRGARTIDETRTFTHTTTTQWSFGINGTANLGKEGTLGSVGIDASYGQSTASSVGYSGTMHVPVHRRGTWSIGQEMHHSDGRIRVNYDTPVGPNSHDKHYIWYINNVKINTPYTKGNIKKLSGGKQTKHSEFTQWSPDVVRCHGKLYSDMKPTFMDTRGKLPPANHHGKPKVVRSRTVAPRHHN